MLTVILTPKLPDGKITLIVMKIIAWHLILLMQNGKEHCCCIVQVDVKKIHKTLVIHTPGENEDEYTKTRDALNNYFMPKKNVEYEIFNFRQEKQKPEESLDMYYRRLKNLATHCEFNSVDREIKSQIIQFCVNNTLGLKALQDPTLTLDKILTLSRTLETSKV